jgi:hypothetical protein
MSQYTTSSFVEKDVSLLGSLACLYGGLYMGGAVKRKEGKTSLESKEGVR